MRDALEEPEVARRGQKWPGGAGSGPEGLEPGGTGGSPDVPQTEGGPEVAQRCRRLPGA